MSSSAEKSKQIHRMWHKRDVDCAVPMRVNLPDDMAVIGEAINIMYSSDKWNEPGEFEDYTHACSSRAPVYEYRASGADIYIEDIMKVPGFKGAVNMTWLANMVELEYRRDDGKRVCLGFKNADLCCLNDKKTLVILRPSGKTTIITGSKMRITAHGIVR